MNANKVITYSLKFKLFTKNSFEDYADKFNFKFTPMFFSIIGISIFIRTYLLKPVACTLIHPETSHHLLKYMEYYCFVDGTSLYQGKSLDIEKDWANINKNRIGYYGWLPFIVGMQILMFYLPNFVWRGLARKKAGRDVIAIIEMAHKTLKLQKEDRKKELKLVATAIGKIIVLQYTRQNNPNLNKYQKFMQKISHFICLYLFVKLMYLINICGQLLFMEHIFKTNRTQVLSLGGRMIVSVLNRSPTDESYSLFPRYTMCYAKVKILGSVKYCSAQCALPLNMLVEKVFLLFWFWCIMMGILIIVTTILWICKLAFNKPYEKIDQLLNQSRMMQNKKIGMDDKVSIRNSCDIDSAFLLLMVGYVCGDIFLGEVIEELYANVNLKPETFRKPDHKCNNEKPSAPLLADVSISSKMSIVTY